MRYSNEFILKYPKSHMKDDVLKHMIYAASLNHDRNSTYNLFKKLIRDTTDTNDSLNRMMYGFQEWVNDKINYSNDSYNVSPGKKLSDFMVFVSKSDNQNTLRDISDIFQNKEREELYSNIKMILYFLPEEISKKYVRGWSDYNNLKVSELITDLFFSWRGEKWQEYHEYYRY